MKQLATHENVLKFIGICRSPFCILTGVTVLQDLIKIEYMAVGDLADYLYAHNDIPMSQQIRWMKDVCHGMRHLISQGIIHR
jgi:serine/threonine protein kinase